MKNLLTFENFLNEGQELNKVKSLQSRMSVKGSVSDNGPKGVQLIQKENQMTHQFDWDIQTGVVNVTTFERSKVVNTEAIDKTATTAEEFLTIVKAYFEE